MSERDGDRDRDRDWRHREESNGQAVNHRAVRHMLRERSSRPDLFRPRRSANLENELRQDVSRQHGAEELQAGTVPAG